MTKAKKLKATYAGANERGQEHQVVTVEGGPFTYRREPCATCPWRRDAVGEFPAEAFRISAHTAYDAAFETFACHSSGMAKPQVCAGFLLKNSANNLGVRIKQSTGQVDVRQVKDGGHALFDSYRAMAIANGVDPEDPILKPCRGDTE